MIYRLNLFLDGKLASTELIEADRIEGAKRIAREALDKGQAHAADLVTMAGRLIYHRLRRRAQSRRTAGVSARPT